MWPSRRLPDEMKLSHPEILWPQVAGIGNVLQHEYGQWHTMCLGTLCATICRHCTTLAEKSRKRGSRVPQVGTHSSRPVTAVIRGVADPLRGACIVPECSHVAAR